MEQRKVRLAYLQSATTLPGLIQTATELSKRTYPEVSMFYTDSGLILTKGNLAAIIPLANIKIAEFANETLSN